jgi:hypothetical protein
MGQVMCALGEWEKAEKTFAVAKDRCAETLALQPKVGRCSFTL